MPLSTLVWVCRQARFQPMDVSRSAYGLYILSPLKGTGPSNRYMGETLKMARASTAASRMEARIFPRILRNFVILRGHN